MTIRWGLLRDRDPLSMLRWMEETMKTNQGLDMGKNVKEWPR